MTEIEPPAEPLSMRRRKLHFRSWHRGMREMDLILGSFADAAIADLTAAEIDQYEQLLDLPDTDLLSWFTGQKPVPEAVEAGVFPRILAFSQAVGLKNS
jgi:antitoxin CptB